jgi:hypothetical protein
MSQSSLFDDEGPPPVLCIYCRERIHWSDASTYWVHTMSNLVRCANGAHFADPPRVADEVAHARRGDPVTSHEAARSLKSEEIRRSQLAVLRLFERFGQMYDAQFIDRYQTVQTTWELPTQSVSGLRTRRSELVAKGLLEDSGEKVIPPGSRRRAIVWRVSGGSSPIGVTV